MDLCILKIISSTFNLNFNGAFRKKYHLFKMDTLPDHIIIDILFKSGDLLSKSLVCTRFHKTIASSATLMDKIQPYYVSGLTLKKTFNKSIRNYRKIIAYLPFNMQIGQTCLFLTSLPSSTISLEIYFSVVSDAFIEGFLES